MLHLQNHAMQGGKGKALQSAQKNAGARPALSL
jgi:hypothetical protein